MPQVNTDNQFQEDHTGITFACCLEQLADMKPLTNCRTCKGPLLVEHFQVGTAIYLGMADWHHCAKETYRAQSKLQKGFTLWY